MDWLTGIGPLIDAILNGDVWTLRTALRSPASWTAGLIVTLTAGFLLMLAYRKSRFLDTKLEPAIMVVSYLTIGIIIFVEVIRRFVFNDQAPWSTTIPPFLFLIMTWFGCSWNVRLRTHLSFSELRTNLPRAGQMACLVLDALLWIAFSWVVMVTSTRVVVNSMSNFQIMLGTDNVMQWWFLLSVPIAFISLVARAMENLLQDFENYRDDNPLIEQTVIGGD